LAFGARVEVSIRFPKLGEAKKEGRPTFGRVSAAGWPDSIADNEAFPNARIGHINLRVADLDHAAKFYREVLGLEITFYGPDIGLPEVLLAVGDYHHHIALNTYHAGRATPPPPGHTGLHHFAILYADEVSLARAVSRVLKRGYPIDDSRDHGGTLSFYLRDIDGNGIELYYDRPRTEWFNSEGRPVIKSDPFDLQKWLDRLEIF
jgi:catechol 2,3-dioxygenase